MGMLVLGLVLFLGAHSTRIVAEGWRTRMVARLGVWPWKGLYTLVSLAGIVLVAWGYSLARQDPVVLWPAPPVWVRHVAALLTLVAFVLFVAGYVPRNQIKARLRHPMVLSVKVWAFAHLVANNTLADLVLFGAFLAWAVADFRSARRRDRVAVGAGVGIESPDPAILRKGEPGKTAVAVVIGVAAWAVFAFALHARWIGVAPLG